MRDIKDKRKVQRTGGAPRAPEDELLRRVIRLQHKRKRQSSVAIDTRYDYPVPGMGEEEKSQGSSPDAQLLKMQMMQDKLAGKMYSKVGMNALNNNYMGKESVGSP